MRKNIKGYTLIELIVTMIIIALVTTVAIVTISGIMPTYKLSRATRSVYNNMVMAKSKAVSLNRTYRLNFLSATSFKLQWQNTSVFPIVWEDEGDVTLFPSDIEIATSPIDYFINAGTNLMLNSRGMLDIPGGVTIDPFIVLRNTVTGEEKSITVNYGGNITINR